MKVLKLKCLYISTEWVGTYVTAEYARNMCSWILQTLQTRSPELIHALEIACDSDTWLLFAIIEPFESQWNQTNWEDSESIHPKNQVRYEERLLVASAALSSLLITEKERALPDYLCLASFQTSSQSKIISKQLFRWTGCRRFHIFQQLPKTNYKIYAKEVSVLTVQGYLTPYHFISETWQGLITQTSRKTLTSF